MIDLNLIKGGKLADTLHGRITRPASPSGAPSTEESTRATSPATGPRLVERLVTELSRPSAAAELRLRILESLERSGPRTSRDIPRSWPVTRQHIRAAFGRLVDDGLVERDTEEKGGGFRLTETGRRVVQEVAGNGEMAAALANLES